MNDREAIKGLQNIVEYWTLNPHEQEVAKHAISALQERVKRNKGCDVCNRSDELTHLDFTHCPYCGRKLREEPHGTNKAERHCKAQTLR